MLLTLLAVALPTAALANSIDFSTGTFTSGTITSNFHNPFSVEVVGSGGTITLDTSTLNTHCAPATAVCTFTSGTVTVKNSAGVTVFTSSVTDGTISRVTPPNEDSITANLVPGTCSPITCTSGSVTFHVDVRGGNLVAGSSATVVGSTSVIPEPGTLGMLGTGVLGLAGMMRRKLKLGM